MPNFLLIALGLLTVLGLSHHSSNANEERSRRELAAMEHPPEHAAIDNSVSPGVLFVCFLILVGFVFLAMPR
jgi:hypothetical protein